MYKFPQTQNKKIRKVTAEQVLRCAPFFTSKVDKNQTVYLNNCHKSSNFMEFSNCVQIVPAGSQSYDANIIVMSHAT